MSLEERITADMRGAMKSRDKARLSTLRMLNSALKNEEIELSRSLSEEEQVNVLRRQLKQREEAADSYRKAGREDRAAAEETEAELIRVYLPTPLSSKELESIVDQALQETGATTMKDMGATMSRARELAENRAEGKELAERVRSRLT
jgi:uncharacterized protein YqeY